MSERTPDPAALAGLLALRAQAEALDKQVAAIRHGIDAELQRMAPPAAPQRRPRKFLGQNDPPNQVRSE